MSSTLSEAQLTKLRELFISHVVQLRLDAPRVHESEPSYTSRVLRPAVQSWVATLKRPDLVVRGDGSMNTPRVLMVGTMSFIPDIEIGGSVGRKYLAIEVKFLRDGLDPTGAFAKAVGQSVIYRTRGFASSHAIILDQRTAPTAPAPGLPDWSMLREMGVFVHWFSRAAGNQMLEVTNAQP